MWIYRKEEKEVINYLNRDFSQLIVVSGRRRVGKTSFVKKILSHVNENGKLGITFTGNNLISDEDNLKEAYKNLENILIFHAMLIENKQYELIFNRLTHKNKSWSDFFNTIILLSNILEKEIVLFFDEINWFSKKDDFLIYFTQKVNEIFGSNLKIKIIIASSISSWLNKNIINNTGGLYQRTGLYIKLEPFSLKEIISYIRSKNKQISTETVLEYYLMFGGIPLYYDFLNFNISFEKNIERIKNKQNILFKERDLLIKSLTRNQEYSKEVISLLSKSKNLNKKEIVSHLTKQLNFEERSVENLVSSILKDLEESELIVSAEKELYKNNKTYFINDLFCYFYYYWWENNREFNFNSQEYNNWKGQAFEIFIFNHIDLIAEELEIKQYEKIINLNSNNKKIKALLSKEDKKKSENYFKTNPNFQIDLLLKQKSKKENIYSIVECKYYKTKYLLDKNKLETLDKKMIGLHHLLEKKSVKNLILITLNGSKVIDLNYELLYPLIEIDFSKILNKM